MSPLKLEAVGQLVNFLSVQHKQMTTAQSSESCGSHLSVCLIILEQTSD